MLISALTIYGIKCLEIFRVTVNDKKGSSIHFAEEIYSKLRNGKILKNDKIYLEIVFSCLIHVVHFFNVNPEYEFLRIYFCFLSANIFTYVYIKGNIKICKTKIFTFC